MHGKRFLGDLGFLGAKCAAGLTCDLIGDYRERAEETRQEAMSPQQPIDEFGRWVKEQAHILHRHPQLTFQQAINQPDDSNLHRAASGLARLRPAEPWLRWVDKPQARSPRVATFAGLKWPADSCACAGGALTGDYTLAEQLEFFFRLDAGSPEGRYRAIARKKTTGRLELSEVDFQLNRSAAR